MVRKFKIMLILVITLSLLSFAAPAQAMFDWVTLKTEYFTVFYQPGDEAVARQVLEILECYRPQVEQLCGNTAKHLAVVINKNGVMVDGFSRPYNQQIHLFDYIPTSESNLSSENWWSLVGVHEYTHHLSLNRTDGFVTLLNNLLGGMFLPNAMTPLWLTEGITVYQESQLSPYQGRLNDGLFDAYLGVLVSEEKLPAIQVATSEQDRFQLGRGYTFGGEFFEYLAKTYGEDRFAEFFRVNGGNFLGVFNFPALGIDRSARKVYGKSFPELWEEWQASLRSEYQNYRPEGERLTRKGWNNSYPVFADGQIFYWRDYPVKTGVRQKYQFHELRRRELNSGQEEVLLSTTTTVALPLKVKNQQLYYATYELKGGYHNQTNLGYGYYLVLHQYDLKQRKDQVIFKEELRGFEVTSDNKILYTKARQDQFGSELYLYDPATKKQEKLLVSDYLIDELVLDREKLIVTARHDWENTDLYHLDLASQKMTPLFKSAEKESNLAFYGEKLYFTANYQQQIGIYAYNFQSRMVERLTKSGYATMAAVDETAQKLYFIGLNSDGFDLYQKPLEPEKYQLTLPRMQSKSATNLQKIEIAKGGYQDNLKYMTPHLSGIGYTFNEEQNAVMFSLRGYDAVGDFPEYNAMLGYDFKQEHFSYNLELTSYFLAPVIIGFKTQDLTEQEVESYAPTLPYQKATQLVAVYDVLERLSPGLSNVAVGEALLKIDDDQFDNLYSMTFIDVSFNYPKTELKLGFDLMQGLEKKYQIYGADIQIDQYLWQGELSCSSSFSTGRDHYLAKLRGYQQRLHTTTGMTMNLEYSKPLIELGAGIWNPNLYLQSLVGKTFVEQALTEADERQLAWGGELQLETVINYRQPLELGFWVAWNQEAEMTYGMNFGLKL